MGYVTDVRRIMFIFPPSTSLASWEPMVPPPMGILYLAAVTREAGYEVKVLDCVVEAPYRETFINDTVSRNGLTYDQILARIEEYDPDAVGLSCVFSNQWPAVKEIARRVKQSQPDRLVLAGGAHPSFLGERCMRDAPIDFILRGESEDTLLELLDRLKKGQSLGDIDGLVRRDGDKVLDNPKRSFIEDLDRLPFPAHDLVRPERYYNVALPMGYSIRSPRTLPVVTSRGCPCRCTFCSSTSLWGNRYRTRSAENVLAELDWLVDRFKVEDIKFQDDNLTVDRKRARELFQGMADRPYRLHWNTPNGIAVWTLDEEMLRLMKKSGCFEITMAVESGNQEVLGNLVRKPLKLEKVREVNDAARRLGIARWTYFIIGFPGETMAQVMDTVNFARELKVENSVMFIYNPLPGSKLFDDCLARGLIAEESFFEAGNLYFSSIVDSDQWTSAELETIIRNEYIRNYGAIFRSPYLVGRRWYSLFRYRPSFLKYLALRTFRAYKLKRSSGQAGEAIGAADG